MQAIGLADNFAVIEPPPADQVSMCEARDGRGIAASGSTGEEDAPTIDESADQTSWKPRRGGAANRKRDHALLLLLPRLVVFVAGPILAKIVFSSLVDDGERNTMGDLVGAILSLGLGLIGGAVTLLVVWILGWVMLRSC